MKPSPKIEWIGLLPDSGPAIIEAISDVLGKADEKTIGNVRFHSMAIFAPCEGTGDAQFQILLWGGQAAINRLKRTDSRWHRLDPGEVARRKTETPTSPPPVPHQARTGNYRKKPVVVSARQWQMVGGDSAHSYQAGVGYYRNPDDDEKRVCEHCGQTMHFHGWIDTLEGGHIVCPGDWIITGVKGELYPCKPDIFEMTYEATAEAPEQPQTPSEDAPEPQDERQTPSEAPDTPAETEEAQEPAKAPSDSESDADVTADKCDEEPFDKTPVSPLEDKPDEPAAANEAPQPDATPPAIELAKKHGIPLSEITPRGKIINKFDVTKAIGARKAEKGDD